MTDHHIVCRQPLGAVGACVYTCMEYFTAELLKVAGHEPKQAERRVFSQLCLLLLVQLQQSAAT